MTRIQTVHAYRAPMASFYRLLGRTEDGRWILYRRLIALVGLSVELPEDWILATWDNAGEDGPRCLSCSELMFFPSWQPDCSHLCSSCAADPADPWGELRKAAEASR